MNWIATHSEVLGLTAALGAGLALLTGLVWIRGRASGLSPQHLTRQLAQVWAALLLALGALLLARVLLGGPLVSGPVQDLRFAAPSGGGLASLAGALAVVVVCFLWARRVVAGLLAPPLVTITGRDDDASC